MCGIVADAVGLQWGYRTLMLSSASAVLTLGAAYYMVRHCTRTDRVPTAPNQNRPTVADRTGGVRRQHHHPTALVAIYQSSEGPVALGH